MVKIHLLANTILSLHIFYFCIYFKSMVFGLYLPNSTKVQTENKEMNTDDIGPRSVGLNRNYLWPSYTENGEELVKVPFVIQDFEHEAFQLFYDMEKVFRNNSCIRWVPHTNESDYVIITSLPQNNYSEDRCNAIIGRADNSIMYLSAKCIRGDKYVVAHEMLHVLNFAHEHQRKDRDCYVQITGPVITDDDENYGLYNFQDTDLTFPYDEESIMQYPDPNIISKFNKKLGPTGEIPNEMDFMKLNYHYCSGKHYCELNSVVAQARCSEHKRIHQQCYKQLSNSTNRFTDKVG